MVLSNDDRKDDDGDGGVSGENNPVLDLPPGVELPSKESILNISTNENLIF